jgi:hypothetical protein
MDCRVVVVETTARHTVAADWAVADRTATDPTATHRALANERL